MSRRGGRDRGKERYWRRLLWQWRRSGQPVRSFCAEHGVSEPSFYAWRRTLAARGRHTTARRKPRGKAQPAFVPVHVTATPPALEVVLGDGRVLRVPVGFDATALRQLLAILAEAPLCRTKL